MITTAYPLSFAFELPPHNPWNGQTPVTLMVESTSPLDPSRMDRLGAALQGFWRLAPVGGLAGDTLAPWLSVCRAPVVSVQGQVARYVFEPTHLDERATSVLLALLLAAHVEVPLAGVRIWVPGATPLGIGFDSTMEDPYPVLWPSLPFPAQIEDSESETRELRAQFTQPLSDDQVTTVQNMLFAWAAAAEWGGFALPPVPPRSSSCLANDPVEHYDGELTWAMDKCRFHPSALDSIVAVCATIHHRVANILELTVE